MLCPLVISQKFTLENRQGFPVAAIGGSTHTQHSTEQREEGPNTGQEADTLEGRLGRPVAYGPGVHSTKM